MWSLLLRPAWAGIDSSRLSSALAGTQQLAQLAARPSRTLFFFLLLKLAGEAGAWLAEEETMMGGMCVCVLDSGGRLCFL